MLVLHHAPDNASLVVRMALLATNEPFRTVPVDRPGALDTAGFRALNPAGRIPALEAPDGPMFETGAILLWLADRHPGAGLAPPAGHPDRGRFLSWLFFLSNTPHADLRHLFYPDRHAPPEGQAGHRALTIARMRAHFRLLDDAARDRPALFALPSALTLYVCTLLRWSVLYPEAQQPWCDPGAFPSLHALARALDIHPAGAEAARHDGLGATPFSAPVSAP